MMQIVQPHSCQDTTCNLLTIATMSNLEQLVHDPNILLTQLNIRKFPLHALNFKV